MIKFYDFNKKINQNIEILMDVIIRLISFLHT